ncbi:MAG: hypothetical protein IJ228_09565 [Succinivibrio sp.]|nr:hypothetical protein [Succinivibrio sp.]
MFRLLAVLVEWGLIIFVALFVLGLVLQIAKALIKYVLPAVLGLGMVVLLGIGVAYLAPYALDYTNMVYENYALSSARLEQKLGIGWTPIIIVGLIVVTTLALIWQKFSPLIDAFVEALVKKLKDS